MLHRLQIECYLDTMLMLFTDLNIVDKVETLVMVMIAMMVWRCVWTVPAVPRS